MKKETYIAAMQKIDLSEQFIQDTIAKLQSEEMQIKDNSSNKSINIKNIIKNKNILKAAVITLVMVMSMTGITVAAARLGIVDIFKGYFKEPVKQENITPGNSKNNLGTAVTSAPITKDNEFFEEASALLSSTTTADGLKLTARGVVGDRHTVYIAVDVETVDGSAFSKKQQSDVKDLSFSKVWLKTNDNVLGQYCYVTRVDDGSETGKATFVLRNSFDTEGDINHISLTFTNLTEPNRDKLVDIGVEKSLQGIMDEIGEASADDFDYMGGRCNNDEDREWYRKKEKQVILELKESGAIDTSKTDYDSLFGMRDQIMEKAIVERGSILLKYCIKRTDEQTTFCTKYPKLAVSNIGIRNNQLCVKFEFNDSISFDSFCDAGIVIVNKKNGSILGGSVDASQPINGNDESQADMVDGKIISCGVQFNGISSKDVLKDYYFAFGGNGYSESTLYEGEWKLDFSLSYTDTTREYKVSKDVKVGEEDRKLEKITISPLSLQLQLNKMKDDNDVANNTQINMLDLENKKYDTIKIIMKDKTQVLLDNQSCEEDTISSVLPVVIDLNQISAVDINGAIVNLE